MLGITASANFEKKYKPKSGWSLFEVGYPIILELAYEPNASEKSCKLLLKTCDSQAYDCKALEAAILVLNTLDDSGIGKGDRFIQVYNENKDKFLKQAMRQNA